MAKKKKTQESSGSDSGGGFIAVIILLIIGAGIYYGMQHGGSNLGSFSESIKEITATSDETNEEPTTTSRPVEEKTPTVKETKAATKSETASKASTSSYEGRKEQSTTNKDLPKYTSENEYYFTSSFDFTWPAYTGNDAIIEHDYFTLSYNEKTEQADWVAYKLTRNHLNDATYKRKDNFRADPLVSSQSASLSDYKGSGYDRGHLAPAADFTWSKEGLDDSFYMSNMSPQEPGFNRGIWKQLEEKVRNMARENGVVYVVTGPIYQGLTKKIGDNKVAVPSKYYKVILDLEGKEVKGIGFILPNKKSNNSLSKYATTIDAVEKATKLDFFPSIPDDLEGKLESQSNYSAW